MLKITRVKPLAGNKLSVSKGNIVDGINGNSKVSGTKSKNMIIPDSLAKSKSLIEPSSKAGFLIFRAKLAFIKLRQIFIEVPIFYHFDLKCYI